MSLQIYSNPRKHTHIHYTRLIQHSKSTLATSLACALVISFGITSWPQSASATEEISRLQEAIEQSGKDYDKALHYANEISSEIDSITQAITKLNNKIPEQKKKSNQALRMLYKQQNQGVSLLDLLLKSENLTDFITSFDYLNLIQERNQKQIKSFMSLKEDLQNNYEELQSKKAQAQEAVDKAKKALEEAEKARDEAQRKAEEEARKEEEAAKKALEEAKQKQGSSAGEPHAGGIDNAPIQAPNNALPSSISWNMSKAAFVAQWETRINNYLAGSPLAGTGAIFAKAAWDYGVDPRWSPAISYTESSKGAALFRPYNAWGWGNKSWKSWDEAIVAHVAGLARGYGSSISLRAAQKYCPPNPQHWYTTTLAQMERI